MKKNIIIIFLICFFQISFCKNASPNFSDFLDKTEEYVDQTNEILKKAQQTRKHLKKLIFPIDNEDNIEDENIDDENIDDE